MARGAQRCAGLHPAVMPPRFVVDTLHGLDAVHPAIDQGEHCRRRWSGVERPITPPRQVAGEDILGVESPSIGKALDEANRHADRTTVAVSRRQSQQHTPEFGPWSRSSAGFSQGFLPITKWSH